MLASLTYAVQYRRQDQAQSFDPWHTMAAFDCEGAARAYFSKQGNEMWEYQLVEIPADQQDN